MKSESKRLLIAHYTNSLRKHGDTPEGVQFSPEGQRFRFEKLIQIADLRGARVLDVGCGLGHLFPFLEARVEGVRYTGVDIVPEAIAYAAAKYPCGHFVCQDITECPLENEFDFALISGVFNNRIPDSWAFLKDLTRSAFSHCRKGLAFNFISTHVNFEDAAMAYYDPSEVLEHCIRELSPRVTLHHHYDRSDVAVFVYRISS
jgi:SAM-dependent methyltransferase